MATNDTDAHLVSHSGNVYTSMYYQESNERWYPLGLLRYGVLVDAERKVIQAAWVELERLLGFNPIVQPSKAKAVRKDQDKKK